MLFGKSTWYLTAAILTLLSSSLPNPVQAKASFCDGSPLKIYDNIGKRMDAPGNVLSVVSAATVRNDSNQIVGWYYLNDLALGNVLLNERADARTLRAFNAKTSDEFKPILLPHNQSNLPSWLHLAACSGY